MANKTFTSIALLCIWTGGFAQSLYEPTSYQPLATDARANAVGDALTVLIYESATATSRANTSADRSSTIDLRATDLDETVGAAFSSNNEFEGGGVERRSGEVIARVSVTIREVLDNGDFRVEGAQHISLNNESQSISVVGRLRREDIFADNTVLSSRLSDAKIEFKGRGLLSSREKPGLLIRFFQWLF